MIDSVNKKHMRISKNPESTIKHGKCLNTHCKNYDSLSESNCVYDIETAMKCLYNEVSQYESK